MAKFHQLFSFQQKEVDSAFENASQHGARLGLKLLITPETDSEHGKLLIIIPRTSGPAHERNKLKRQIKSIFYENKLYEKPVVWILVVYKEATKLSFEEISSFMKKYMC